MHTLASLVCQNKHEECMQRLREEIREYTLGQFLTAAGITWPTWAKWVKKGVAPEHYRIGQGRNVRIAA
jgi:hypothetical protein